MIARVLRLTLAALIAGLLVVTGASASTYVYEAALDVDNSASTGGVVNMVRLGQSVAMPGVDFRVQATVDTAQGKILRTEVLRWNGTSFVSAGVDATSYAVGAGPRAIEFDVSRALVGNPSGLVKGRFHATLLSESASDYSPEFTLQLGDVVIGNVPEPIPAIGHLMLVALIALVCAIVMMPRLIRHRGGRLWLGIVLVMLITSTTFALAATIILDGNVGDWTGIAPVFTDPTGHSSLGDANEDLVAGYVTNDAANLYFRVDIASIVPPRNEAPVVSAGSDQLVTLPSGATLGGSATDDGLPDPPGLLTSTWTQDSGPAGAVITDPSHVITTVSFTQVGTYVFRLTASDGVLSSSATTQVVVGAVVPAIDQPPVLGDQANVTLAVGSAFDRALVATDPDPGDSLDFTLMSGPTGMTLDGASLHWATTGRSAGNYPVVVRVTDHAGQGDTKQFLITLTQANLPLAYDDHYQVVLGQTLTVPATGVLANDVEPSGATLAATLLVNPGKGMLTSFNADGSFVYTAPAAATPAFDPVVLWHTTLTYNTTAMLVAPVLGDGQPYVIESNFNNVYAVNAKDGSVLWHAAASVATNESCTFGGYLAAGSTFQQVIGDIDDSGHLAIVFPTECAPNGINEGPARLIALDARTGNVQWLSPPLGQVATDASGTPGPLGPDFPRVDDLARGTQPTLARLAPGESPSIVIGIDLGIGTFGGQPECAQLVAGWPARTGCRGVIVVDGKDGSVRRTMAAPLTARGGEDVNTYSNGTQSPVVADLEGTGAQQIIYGGAVFNADGSVKWNSDSAANDSANNSTTWWNGVANFDDSPDIEVVRLMGNQAAAPYQLAVFKSDGNVLWQLPFTGAYDNVLPPVIADVDASGHPSILMSIGNPARYLCAIDYRGRYKWCYDAGLAADTGSNLRQGTTVSVYDLEGTGVPDVVVQLYDGKVAFLDGSDGLLKSTFDVKAAIGSPYTLNPTLLGGPVVAAFDGSGHAAVLTAWGGTPGVDPIVAISSQGNAWRPARPIWNQAMFYGGNVSDDGTLPQKFVNSFAAPATNVFGVSAQVAAPVDPLSTTQTSFMYTASDGAQTSAPGKVTIDLLPAVQPLRVTSIPPTFYLASASSFAYQLTVVDPNAGGTLAYKIISADGGNTAIGHCSIGATTGLFSCQGGFGSGTQSFVILVTDQYGATGAQSFTLQESAGDAPVPNVVGEMQPAATSTVVAAGFTVGNVTQMFADAPVGQITQQNPDAGASVPLLTPIDLVVSLGAQHPAGPAPSLVDIHRISVSPLTTALRTGEKLTYSAVAVYGDGTSADITTYAAWGSTAPAVATVDVAGMATAVAAGIAQLSASVGSVSGTATLTVVARVVDATAPTAVITRPAAGDTVTTVTPILGTATDANFVRYELSVAGAGSSTFATIGVGTTAVSNGTLGSFDPTALLNGAYTLRLTVFDAGGNSASTDTAIVVAGNDKVGAFTITYDDVSVPVSGLSVQVVRSYDSRNKNMGDFGIGWTLGVNTFQVSESGVLGDGWQVDQAGVNYLLSSNGAHFVSVALPNGHVETFDITVTPNSSPFAPFTTLQALFVPRAGTLGTLQSLDNTNLLIADPQPGPVTLLDDTTLNTFNPDRFRYTTLDGTQYVLTRSHGVESVTDTNGNHVTVGAAGITSSSGPGIAFARDARGRITSITDPNGRTQTYTYSPAGDLVAHADATSATTTYFYTAQHGLVRIVDPLGRPVARTEYDDQGRVVAITDAAGYTTTYSHDIAGRQEQSQDALGRITIRTYDDRGNVLSVADPLGRTSTYTYDAQDNELTITNPLGETTDVTYDANNFVLSATDPLGRVTRFTRDAGGRPLTQTDPLGNTTTMQRDAKGNLLGIVDALGTTTALTRDATGNLTSRTDATGATTRNQYDGAGRRTQLTNAVGGAITMAYDANGNLLSQNEADGVASNLTLDANNRIVGTSAGATQRSISYDIAGQVTQVTTGRGQVMPVALDPVGRLTAIQAPGGTPLVQQAYDPVGNAVLLTDALGNQVKRTYDAANQLIATQWADGSIEKRTYDDAGRLTQVTDALGHATSYRYDAAGELLVITDAAGGQTRYQYDANSNKVSQTDPAGHTTQFDYDALNRLVKTTYADGTSELFSYDAVGRVVQKVDTAGNGTINTYDALGRIASVTDALGNTTKYGYAGPGRPSAVTDARGNVTRYVYDSAGRMTQTTYPLGETQTVSYDTSGNVLTQTNGLGETIQRQYDANGRLSAVSLPDGTTERYAYTLDNLLASVSDARGTTTLAYDPQTRKIVQVTEPDGRHVRYTYDAVGNRTMVAHGTDAAELATYYAYDALNRNTQITDPAGGMTTQAFDAAGNVVTIARPNGVITQMAYDARNRVVSIVDRDSASHVLESEIYTLDALGNRTRIDRSDGSRVEYRYDALGRVVDEQRVNSANAVTAEFVYSYDAAGNLVTKGPLSAPAAYTYNADNQLVAGGGNTYTYDAAGRRVQRTPSATPSLSVHYAWDAKDQLTSFRDASGATTNYAYDVDGARQAKSGAAGAVDFLVDRNNATGFSQILHATATGDDRNFVFGTQLLETRDPGSTLYRQFDHLGSTLALTGASGVTTDTFDYEAYGDLLVHTGSSTAPHRYAGEENDPESALTYLRARYYDPATGSFLSRDPSLGDPSEPASLNPYPYAAGNPVNRTDPSGRDTLAELSLSEMIQYSQNAQELYNKQQAVATAEKDLVQADRNLGGILALNAVVEAVQDGGSRAKFWFAGGKVATQAFATFGPTGGAYGTLIANIGATFGHVIDVIAIVGMGKVAFDMLEGGRNVKFYVDGVGILLSSDVQSAVTQLVDSQKIAKTTCSGDPTLLAFAYPSDAVGDYEIGLCTKFFAEPPLPSVFTLTTNNESSQSGLMVHEFSHVSLGTLDKAYGCFVGGNLPDTFIGGSKRLLTAFPPGFALVNADSYRCWAEDAYLNYTGPGSALSGLNRISWGTP